MDNKKNFETFESQVRDFLDHRWYDAEGIYKDIVIDGNHIGTIRELNDHLNGPPFADSTRNKLQHAFIKISKNVRGEARTLFDAEQTYTDANGNEQRDRYKIFSFMKLLRGVYLSSGRQMRLQLID